MTPIEEKFRQAGGFKNCGGDVWTIPTHKLIAFITAQEQRIQHAETRCQRFDEAMQCLMLSLSVGGKAETVDPDEASAAIRQGIDMLMAPLIEVRDAVWKMAAMLKNNEWAEMTALGSPMVTGLEVQITRLIGEARMDTARLDWLMSSLADDDGKSMTISRKLVDELMQVEAGG